METKKSMILQRGSVMLTCSYGEQNRIDQKKRDDDRSHEKYKNNILI